MKDTIKYDLLWVLAFIMAAAFGLLLVWLNFPPGAVGIGAVLGLVGTLYIGSQFFGIDLDRRE